MNVAAITSCFAALLIGLLYYWNARRAQKANLPPGPAKLPLIGSVHHIPRSKQWETFARWSQVYGSDILHVKVFGISFVVLNSYSSCVDLLNQRSSIYSSRPHIPLIHEMTGLDYIFLLLPYGPRWRSARRMFTKYFNPSRADSNHRTELRYMKKFMLNLLEDPGRYMKHVDDYVVGIATSLTYGLENQSTDNSFVQACHVIIHSGPDLLGIGGFLATLLPGLKHLSSWMPQLESFRLANSMKLNVSKMRDTPFEDARNDWKTGLHQSSFVSNGLDENLSDEELVLLKETANLGWMAALVTTPPVIVTFLLAMVLHPEAQKRGQEELDRVLDGRPPNHSDLQYLPYICAIFREVLRWRPVLPMGVPHALIQDDIYQNYLIPKGSIVVSNQWAMLMDETAYPDPGRFSPERHLKDGRLNPDVLDPAEIAFGFGRRECPGRYSAEPMLQFTFASIMAYFKLRILMAVTSFRTLHIAIVRITCPLDSAAKSNPGHPRLLKASEKPLNSSVSCNIAA